MLSSRPVPSMNTSRDMPPHRSGPSDAAQDRDDDAQDGRLVAVDDLVLRITRFEQHMAVAAPVDLHRGLAVDHRGDDLAGMGLLLLADDHDVTITDGRVDHRVAAYPQREDRAPADQFPG